MLIIKCDAHFTAKLITTIKENYKYLKDRFSVHMLLLKIEIHNYLLVLEGTSVSTKSRDLNECVYLCGIL